MLELMESIREQDGFAEPFEYDVRGTPCEQVVSEDPTYFAADVKTLFPEDRWLQEAGVESYLAIPLFDSASNPIGHLGVMHTEPMTDVASRESLLRVFAGRSAAELEREWVEERLLTSERGAREQFAHLDVLYNEAPLGLCHMDTDLRYLRCNDKLAEMNGIPVADHIGSNLVGTIHSGNHLTSDAGDNQRCVYISCKIIYGVVRWF